MDSKEVLKDRWVPVSNVDPMKRKPKEWAAIYNVQLLEIIDGIWSEYEWAFNFPNLKYFPLPDKDSKGQILDSYERSAGMELRALELKRDLLMGADLGEKHILTEKKRYVETDWVRRKLNLL